MSECQECGATEDIHQHHISYDRDETIPLCASCHATVHSSAEHELKPVDERPANNTTIPVSEDVQDRLRRRKAKHGQTYDELLADLLDSTDGDGDE